MKYLTKILNEASKSEHRMQHATILMRGGSIVACACNRPGVHSEIAALNKVKRDKRKGLTFINIRIRKDGTIGLSMPCLKCQQRFRDEGITSGLYSVGYPPSHPAYGYIPSYFERWKAYNPKPIGG